MVDGVGWGGGRGEAESLTSVWPLLLPSLSKTEAVNPTLPSPFGCWRGPL